MYVQRAANVENSTYDLYGVPKDSDSQNPDGQLLSILYNNLFFLVSISYRMYLY